MKFAEYQGLAVSFSFYPEEYKIIYPTLGLCGEAGEVAEKIKKILRDKNGNFDSDAGEDIKRELGDCLWYIANIAFDLGICLDEVASINIDKLRARKEKGTLQGSGDNR